MKHIYELIRAGKIAFSEEALGEFEEENKDDDKEKEDKEDDLISANIKLGTDTFESVSNANENKSFVEDQDDFMNRDPETEEDNSLFYQGQDDDGYFTNPNEYDQPYEQENQLEDTLNEIYQEDMIDQEVEVEDNTIKKIQTVDIISKIISKYDEYINKVDSVTWSDIVNVSVKSKRKELSSWEYVEDMHTLLNKSLANQNIEYLNIYNNLYDKLTNGKWEKGLSVYKQQNFGRPFVTEGIFLLMYELSFDWAMFMGKFFKDNPEINPDKFEDDSFVRTFPNLTLLTYIAKLITESTEFDKFMTSEDAFNLIYDDTKYNITLKQIKQKKDLIKSAGESLTYYANLVRENYADILAGVLDKLGTVIFLHNNCKVSFNERLALIRELIIAVSTKTQYPVPVNNSKTDTTGSLQDTTNGMLTSLESMYNNLLLARQEARLKLDSDKNNYILKIQ